LSCSSGGGSSSSSYFELSLLSCEPLLTRCVDELSLLEEGGFVELEETGRRNVFVPAVGEKGSDEVGG